MFGAEWGYGGYTQFHLVVWIILLMPPWPGSSGAYHQVNRQNKNGAVASAVLGAPVDLVHFDWLWRVRPVLALLVWDTRSRSKYKIFPHPMGRFDLPPSHPRPPGAHWPLWFVLHPLALPPLILLRAR